MQSLKNHKELVFKRIKIPAFFNFFVVFGFVVVFYLFAFRFAAPLYETNDDSLFMMLYSGYFTGKGDYHSIFNSIFTGMLLIPLYKSFPITNWYTIFLLFTQILSISAIIFLIQRHATDRKIWFLTMFIIPTILYSIFFLNFTSTSGLAASSACFIWMVTREKKFIALALLLFTLGAMIRLESAFYVFVPAIIYSISIREYRLNFYFSFIAFLAIGLVLFIFNSIAYSDAEWRQYFKINKSAARVINYPVKISSDGFSKIQNQIGWSSNDLELYYNWFWADNDLIEPSKIDLIYQKIKDEHHSSLFPMTYEFMIKLKGWIFCTFMPFLTILLFLIVYRGEKLLMFGQIVAFFFLFCLSAYLFQLRLRGVVVICLAHQFVAIYHWLMHRKQKEIDTKILIIFSLCLGISFSNFGNTMVYTFESRWLGVGQLNYLNRHNKPLYISLGVNSFRPETFSPLTNHWRLSSNQFNIIFIASACNTPIQKFAYIKNRMTGLNDLTDRLLDSSNTRLIATKPNAERIKIYLKERRNILVNYKSVENDVGLEIFMFWRE
jgi:hypothetical protein